MAWPGDRPQLELRGLKKRGGTLAAVLALSGAKPQTLRRAAAQTAMMADRCILVAVNGGLRACRASRRRPDLWVGDADSTGRAPGDVESVLFPKEKDYSDLAGAFAELRRRRVQIVGVAGLVGGRLDQEWGNLFELGRHARHFAGILAPTDRGTVLVTSHGCTAATVRGRTVSLFSLTSTSVVTLSGTRWELQRRRLEPGTHGLSNVTGTRLDLTVHSGTVALVLVPARRSGRGSRQRS
jgi:thiamine pyrophosphokinase